MWQVYILKCADGTYYTGMTTDLKRRIMEHNESALGAKYTKGRRPVKLAYHCGKGSRSGAALLEGQIKKMTKRKKAELIKTGLNIRPQ